MSPDASLRWVPRMRPLEPRRVPLEALLPRRKKPREAPGGRARRGSRVAGAWHVVPDPAALVRILVNAPASLPRSSAAQLVDARKGL